MMEGGVEVGSEGTRRGVTKLEVHMSAEVEPGYLQDEAVNLAGTSDEGTFQSKRSRFVRH
jgi:hypothetical protein